MQVSRLALIQSRLASSWSRSIGMERVYFEAGGQPWSLDRSRTVSEHPIRADPASTLKTEKPCFQGFSEWAVLGSNQ